MQVEIYDERELDSESLTTEPTEEQLELINELGLKNQISDSGAPLIYPKVTENQSIIIKTLFSQCTELKNYDAGRIPLRVLKEIKYYKSEYPEHTLVIYHEPDLKIKDPVLLAYPSGLSSYYYERLSNNPTLIARWGTALESWDVLYEKATKKLASTRMGQLLKIRSQVDTAIEAIKSGAVWTNTESPHLMNME